VKVAIPFVLGLCALAALPVGAQDAPAEWKGEETPENLKALFEAIRAAADAGDAPRAAALTRGLLCTKDDYDAVLSPDLLEEQRKKVEAACAIPADMPAEKVARLLVPGGDKTEVVVYTATVAEVRAMEKGSVAEREFPGGARKVAEKLRPDGRKLHEVVVRKPGEQAGVKFHLFFWNGKAWKMLGPCWRALS
jgi:hypothetical protein